MGELIQGYFSTMLQFSIAVAALELRQKGCLCVKVEHTKSTLLRESDSMTRIHSKTLMETPLLSLRARQRFSNP